MKNTVRKAFVPRMAFVSMSATARPPTFMARVLTATKAQLYQKACVKVLSAKTFVKFERPMKVASLTVVNWQNARYTPCMNGIMKPMINAPSVGSTNIGHHLFMAFSTSIPPE